MMIGSRYSDSSGATRHAARRLFRPHTIVGLLAVFALMIAFIPAPGSTAAGPPIYPDLRNPPPFNLYFEQGWDGIWRLRFANTVANHGGRLEITVDSGKRIYQNVYDALTGGSLVSTTKVGSDLIFHPTHNHFHFADFARYDLLVKDSRGAYRRSPRESQKTTYCILDYQKINAPGPSWAQYTTCGASYQGLSAGWSDTYTADLPDQWIVLGSSRLADGDYAIRSTVDPYNKLRESNESNNEGITYFSVRNGQIGASGPPPLCRTIPESAPVGAAVTLKCERFGNSEQVDVRWGGPSTTPLQTVTSDGSGNVETVVTVPEGGIGNHYFIATGRSSGKEVAAIFNTQPSVTRQHWNRTVGSTTTISLLGWSPGEEVRVNFAVSAGSNPLVGATTVNAMGSGSLLMTVPVSTIGRHTITATGMNSGRTATAVINVNPSIQVVPTTVNAGQGVGVSLRGYGGRETVTVSLNGNVIGQVVTSSTGSTTASAAIVTVPTTTTEGTYTVSAAGTLSGGLSSTTLQVTGIDLAEEPTESASTPEPEETPVGEPGEGGDITPTPTEDVPSNAAPTANAGPDQTIEIGAEESETTVTLDGTASFDPDGGELTGVWTVPDGDDLDLLPDELTTGLQPTVQLSAGVHIITLTVTDSNGATATDEVIITIERLAAEQSDVPSTPSGD